MDDDEQLNQRIKYLTEHGGLWDDPIADIRRSLRVILILVAVTCVGAVVAMLYVH
jgi:hypothetical protein